MRTFRSVEFRDAEGDLVIGHGFLDDAGARSLVDRLLAMGATEVQVCDLTPPSVVEARAVRSGDDEVPRLE